MLPLLVWVLSALPAGAVRAGPQEDAYVGALLDEARGAGLSDDPYWHTLLHYKGGVFGFRSLVDDPRFFLAENGKKEPQAELEATIRAFFQPPPDSGDHPVCRFVARYEWLREKLPIDASRLPVPGCARFEALLEEIQPESATLIFPTSHMNSPASMYGHTLLTVRTKDKSDLLSYAINYSAVTTETFGPLYIVNGLFGRYKGYFSILPYYAKLQEYSDVNDRDIWEYPLDLDATEIRRLLAHVYELQDIYSGYFFFSENCSYDLLFLLDAARPGLHLTDECAWWVIPLDTIRGMKTSGLIREAVYRPSRSTKIKHLASQLPEGGIEDALGVAEGTVDPDSVAARDVPADEKIATCELAGEVLQYRYAKKELAKEPYTRRFLQTLRVRSALGETPDEENRPIPVPERPDEGHRSNRVSLGFGFDEDRPIQEFRLRAAYHSLLDNDAGYKRGSQIVFGEITMRYESQDGALALQGIDLIDIVSLAPRDAFFKHTSWKIRTDLFRRTMPNREDYLVYRLNPGFGLAYENRILGICYGLIETDLHVGGVLDPNYSLGAGGTAGLLKNLTGSWTLHAFAGDVCHGLGDTDNLVTAGLGQNLKLSPNMSLALEFEYDENDHDSGVESILRWNAFF